MIRKLNSILPAEYAQFMEANDGPRLQLAVMRGNGLHGRLCDGGATGARMAVIPVWNDFLRRTLIPAP
ncbi:MAG TPA: hypothetical protein VIQ05_14875 [Tardiphaga sp.]